jgi:hypothetical protein
MSSIGVGTRHSYAMSNPARMSMSVSRSDLQFDACVAEELSKFGTSRLDGHGW